MKIVVLGGGVSTERQVSLVTATSVCKALRSLGHQAVFVDLFMGLEDYHGRLEDAFDAPDGLVGQVAIDKTAPDLNKAKVERVRCQAQAELAAKLEPMLDPEEAEILRRGRNAHVSHAPKSATMAQYHAATALEALLGYLYLCGRADRIRELMNTV